MQELPDDKKWRLTHAFDKLLDPSVLEQVIAAYRQVEDDPQGSAYVLQQVDLTVDDLNDFVTYLETVAGGNRVGFFFWSGPFLPFPPLEDTPLTPSQGSPTSAE